MYTNISEWIHLQPHLNPYLVNCLPLLNISLPSQLKDETHEWSRPGDMLQRVCWEDNLFATRNLFRVFKLIWIPSTSCRDRIVCLKPLFWVNSSWPNARQTAGELITERHLISDETSTHPCLYLRGFLIKTDYALMKSSANGMKVLLLNNLHSVSFK